MAQDTYHRGQMDLIEAYDACKPEVRGGMALDDLCDYLSETALEQAALDLVAGLELDDPRHPHAAKTANRFLMAIDWLNGCADCLLTFKQCCFETDCSPIKYREELADKLGLPHWGWAARIRPPEWFAAFAGAIPHESVKNACRAALAAGPEHHPSKGPAQRRKAGPDHLASIQSVWAASAPK